MLSRFLSVAVMLFVVHGVLSANVAQAAAKDDVKAIGEKPKSKAKPTVKKDESRLPPYYRDVVTDDQRKEISTVYARFNTKLAKLKAEIKSLTAERDQALEALLSQDQKEKLAQLKVEAKNQRAKQSSK